MNDNELKALIERYMAGQTSIEEEKRLGEHFRNNDVGEEWAAYKAMFAWLDDGLPLENNEPKLSVESANAAKRPHKRTLTATLFAAVAAAIAVLLVMTLTQNGGQQQPLQPTNVPPLAAKTATMTDTLAADTTSEQTQKPMKKSRKRRRNPYILPHPTTLMAQTERDSINAIANRMAEERLRQIEREQAFMLNMIDKQYDNQAKNINLIMAALESGAYYDDEETIEEY